MKYNAFLPREYRSFNEFALITEIGHLDDIITRLPANEILGPLRQEAEEARQKLFDEFLRRGEAQQLQAEA